jgi:DNA-binding NtrC family response regulator
MSRRKQVTPRSGGPPFLFGEAVSASAEMGRVFELLSHVATSDFTVLLQGETGTGKDILARALHAASSRRDGPLVIVDCGSLPPTLVESELFGHARGAFTGATAERAGAFWEARGGTLFLDEVGELPLEVQPRLLRVLETGTVKRVGEDRYRAIDARVVAATHRDLEQHVVEKRFREDLFFRLAVLPTRIPPLRERKEDIPLLVRAFLAQLGRSDVKISEPILEALAGHDWPGNARELRNVVSRMVAGCELVLRGRRAGDSDDHTQVVLADSRTPFKQAKRDILSQFTRAYVADLRRREGGNLSRMARTAGVSRNHLRELIARNDSAED